MTAGVVGRLDDEADLPRRPVGRGHRDRPKQRLCLKTLQNQCAGINKSFYANFMHNTLR